MIKDGFVCKVCNKAFVSVPITRCPSCKNEMLNSITGELGYKKCKIKKSIIGNNWFPAKNK